MEKRGGETHLSHELLLLLHQRRLALDAQQQRQSNEKCARASDPRRRSNLPNSPLSVRLGRSDRIGDGGAGGRRDDVLEGGEALAEGLLRGVVQGELRVFFVVEFDVWGYRRGVGPVVFVDFLDLNPARREGEAGRREKMREEGGGLRGQRKGRQFVEGVMRP
jgi:hypothetical protein